MRKLFSKLLAGLFLLVAFPAILSAQNLVPNPGFEIIDDCSVAGIPGSIVQASPWTGATCSPDLLSYCIDFDNFSLPVTLFGNVDAFEGEAIAGIYLATKEGVNSTGSVVGYETIQVSLLDTLEKDSFYKVEFHVAAGRHSNPYAGMFIDKVGIHFSSDFFEFYNESCQASFGIDTLFTIGNTLSTPIGEIIDDVGVWRKYCWIYKAKGTESNMMIGYFNPPETINFISFMPGTDSLQKSAYYFFDEISITPIPAPQADPIVAETIALCPNQTSVEISARPHFTNVVWSTGETTSTITVSDTGWYYLQTPLEDCGEIIDSVYVSNGQAAGALVLEDAITVCADDFPYQLFSEFPVFWPDGGQATEFLVSGPGSYVATLTNECGLLLRDTVIIGSDTVPVFNLPDTLVVCAEDLGSYFLTAPEGFTDYSWSNGQTTQEISVTIGGDYAFSGQHPCGTVATTTHVLVNETPTANWPDTVWLCPGEEYLLELPATFASDSWSDGFVGRSRVISTNGNYSAELVHACGTISLEITVQYSPEIQIFVAPNISLNWGDSTNFALSVFAAPPFQISLVTPTGDSSTVFAGDYYRPLVGRLYELTLIDAAGCIATASSEVSIIRDNDFYLPNAFSPNFDGINDALMLFPGPAVSELRELRVYDRWGGLIYAQESVSLEPEMKLWEGFAANGKSSQTASYLITFELKYFDGSNELVVQDILLLR